MPMARIVLSLSMGPSRFSPTGRPLGDMPAGRERLGTPAQLPGPMLRIVVVKVSIGGPPSMERVPVPFTGSMGAGRTGEVGKRRASRALSAK
jgi:hypothetical protein